MNRHPEVPADQPDHYQQDYINALNVMAEAIAVIDEEYIREHTPELIEDAEEVTYHHGVRLPRAFVGWAEWHTYRTAPERAVEEAEAITRRRGERKEWAPERPQRINDLSIEALRPGARVLVYNDSRGENMQALARHEVIVSEPYIRETSAGRALVAVLARTVNDHESDDSSLYETDGLREVPLSAWGIAPNTNGLYSQTKFIEPYVAQTEPLQVKSVQT